MITRLTINEISQAIEGDNYSNFSRIGSLMLAEFLDHYMPEDEQLDLAAIRGQFSEYPTLAAWLEDIMPDTGMAADEAGLDEPWDEIDPVERELAIRKYAIEKKGVMLLEFDSGVIVQSN